jgi:hypothetical protein
MFEQFSTEDLISFLQRQDSTVLVGRTPLEAWRCYLIKVTGTSGTLRELEDRFLNLKGGTGKTTSDLLHSYLNGKGFGSGSIKDKVKNYSKGVVSP